LEKADRMTGDFPARQQIFLFGTLFSTRCITIKSTEHLDS